MESPSRDPQDRLIWCKRRRKHDLLSNGELGQTQNSGAVGGVPGSSVQNSGVLEYFTKSPGTLVC